MKYFVSLGFLVMVLSSCRQPREKNPPLADTLQKKDIEDVSIINLISKPEKYYNTRITVIGYLNLEFEGDGLYLHKEDYDLGITKNGVWISLPKETRIRQEAKKINKHYVLIEGVFSKDMGHFDMWSGSIDSIKRVELRESENLISTKKRTTQY